jgi:hypothetical protein
VGLAHEADVAQVQHAGHERAQPRHLLLRNAQLPEGAPRPLPLGRVVDAVDGRLARLRQVLEAVRGGAAAVGAAERGGRAQLGARAGEELVEHMEGALGPALRREAEGA